MTDTKTAVPATREKPPEPKPKRLDLSATQLVGGALAAMTSAVIGARLGVAGTVLGAAIASIVAGVAGTLYTTSLRHTKNKITSAFVVRDDDTVIEVTKVSEGPSTAPPTAIADDTVVKPRWDTVDWDTTRPAAAGRPMGYDSAAVGQPAAAAPASAAPVARSAETGTTRTRFGLPWKPILLSAAAVFALAFAGITGYELVSGQTLSGGDGTTITQVSEGRTGPQAPIETETSAEPSAEPSTSAQPSESAEPSTPEAADPTVLGEPGPSDSPSTGDSAQPSTGDSPTDPGQAGIGNEAGAGTSGDAGGTGNAGTGG